ncbi:MAG: DKNYY domain-containing protein [bacterium]
MSKTTNSILIAVIGGLSLVVVGAMAFGGLYLTFYVNNALCLKLGMNSNFAKDCSSLYFYTTNWSLGIPVKSYEEIKEADFATFKVVQNLYAKDKNVVFYEAAKLSGANPATFAVINRLYAKDDDQIFYEDKEVSGADVESFSILQPESQSQFKWHESIAVDKHSVYLLGKKQEQVDRDSFHELVAVPEFFYDREGLLLYFGDRGFVRVQGADVDSWRNVDGPFYSDKNAIWLRDHDYVKVLENIDRATFEVLKPEIEQQEKIFTPYLKDKNHIYLFRYDKVGIL